VHADPESAKKTDDLTVFFALLKSALVKAACKTLMKLTPGAEVAFNMTGVTNFNIEIVLDQF